MSTLDVVTWYGLFVGAYLSRFLLRTVQSESNRYLAVQLSDWTVQSSPLYFSTLFSTFWRQSLQRSRYELGTGVSLLPLVTIYLRTPVDLSLA